MIKKIKKSRQQGFTLIELIIVIAIISIIAAVVFVAVDPATRFADARNAKRWQATGAILDAVKMYQIDNRGNIPSGIDTTLRMLGTDGSGCDINCGGGSGGGSSSFVDDTQAEFDAGTYSDTQWDGANSWVELDATGSNNGSGNYTSSVKDAGSGSSWDNIAWVPQRPTGKELPNNAQSETAYNSGNANMTGNVLLMHLNESSGTIVDSSGEGNDGTYNGSLYAQSGKLNGAIGFSPTDVITVPDDSTLRQTAAFTVSVWLDINALSSYQYIVNKWTYSGGSFRSWSLNTTNNNLHWRASTAGTDGTTQIVSYNYTPHVGQWTHLTGVYNGTNLILYINGSSVGSTPLASVISTSQDVYIGAGNLGASFGLNGDLDEVAIYNRALGPTEIADIYKRGALKFQTQVRSCDDAACSGESFIGPDGTGSTYYEWGTSNPITLPSFTLTNVIDNQYFQYQSTFETDNSSYSPELKSVEVDYASGGSSGETTASSCLDLSTDLSYYLPTIPQDPKDGSAGKTYYAIKQSGSQGGTTIISCSPESGEDISKSK